MHARQRLYAELRQLRDDFVGLGGGELVRALLLHFERVDRLVFLYGMLPGPPAALGRTVLPAMLVLQLDVLVSLGGSDYADLLEPHAVVAEARATVNDIRAIIANTRSGTGTGTNKDQDDDETAARLERQTRRVFRQFAERLADRATDRRTRSILAGAVALEQNANVGALAGLWRPDATTDHTSTSTSVQNFLRVCGRHEATLTFLVDQALADLTAQAALGYGSGRSEHAKARLIRLLVCASAVASVLVAAFGFVTS